MSPADARDAGSVRAPDSDGGPRTTGVRAVLDSLLGFFVWAAHLLIVYGATAVACQFGIGRADSSSRTIYLAVLALITILMASGVLLHALRRWRQFRADPERRFRATFTVGNDLVATVAIVWQLLALSIVPLCA